MVSDVSTMNLLGGIKNTLFIPIDWYKIIIDKTSVIACTAVPFKTVPIVKAAKLPQQWCMAQVNCHNNGAWHKSCVTKVLMLVSCYTVDKSMHHTSCLVFDIRSYHSNTDSIVECFEGFKIKKMVN